MADLEFYSQTEGIPLDRDPVEGCAVVEQFAGWFVRPVSDTSITPMYQIDGRFYELRLDKKLNGFVLPMSSRLQRDLVKQINSTAGLLRLYMKPPVGEPRLLDPPLYIGPGSLTELEYSALLDRLGQLAFAHDSAIDAPVTIRVGEQAKGEFMSRLPLHDRLIATARAVHRLHETMEENWGLLRRSPARDVRLVPHVINVACSHLVRSPRIAQKVAERPDRRRQEIDLPEESTDTVENRFLAFLLKEALLRQAKPLAALLRQRAVWLRCGHKQTIESKYASYRNLWRKRRASAIAASKQIDELAIAVGRAGIWASTQLQEPFVAPSVPHACVPLYPSTRLVDSKEYGPIYRAFCEQSGSLVQFGLDGSHSFQWALEERAVRPSWLLFEIWVFLETYALLSDIFGFHPVGETPFDVVDVVSEEIVLPEGSRFSLAFVPTNSTSDFDRIDAVLHYNPLLQVPPCGPGAKRCFSPAVCGPSLRCYREIVQTGNWSTLNPDVLLELRTNGKALCFALDAKYRRYGAMKDSYRKEREQYPVDTMFDLDLLGTAKMKYLNALDCKAAFIVHSDPGAGYTVLGNEQPRVFPHREKNEPNYWPGHGFGAIFASPLHLENLEQVLRCMLMYHVGVDDVCWSCRKKLTQENGGKNRHKNPRWVGDYYQCPDCGRFWISTVCQGWQHHRLIKMGRDSFHKTKPNNQWLCICPACGDDFQPPQEEGE